MRTRTLCFSFFAASLLFAAASCSDDFYRGIAKVDNNTLLYVSKVNVN